MVAGDPDGGRYVLPRVSTSSGRYFLNGAKVAGLLDGIASLGRDPKPITVGNGPRFHSKVIDPSAHWHEVPLQYIWLAKPVETSSSWASTEG